MTPDTKIAEELRKFVPCDASDAGEMLDRAADRIESDAKEITRLRALVESAYREGMMDCPYNGPSQDSDVGDLWNESDARRALDAKGGG